MSKSKEQFQQIRERDRHEDDRHLDDGYYFDQLKMQHAELETNPNKQQHGNEQQK